MSHDDVVQSKANVPFSWEQKPGVSKVTHQEVRPVDTWHSRLKLPPPSPRASKSTRLPSDDNLQLLSAPSSSFKKGSHALILASSVLAVHAVHYAVILQSSCVELCSIYLLCFWFWFPFMCNLLFALVLLLPALYHLLLPRLRWILSIIRATFEQAFVLDDTNEDIYHPKAKKALDFTDPNTKNLRLKQKAIIVDEDDERPTKKKINSLSSSSEED